MTTRYRLFFMAIFWACACAASPCAADDTALTSSKSCDRIPARVVRELEVPRCYHEGLYYDGTSMWLANGEGGKIWVIDLSTGEVLDEITPVAGFTEAIAARGDGTYYTSDWDEMKVYRARLEARALIPEASVSVAPAHPAGIVWTGDRLYVIIWTRGVLGTRFSMLEMDAGMNVLRTITIRSPQEPCQLAWDGTYLWMSSWFDRKVYKIDVKDWEIVGYFCSPVEKATGVAWDGARLWLTGTYGNLFGMEIGKSEREKQGGV